MSTPEDKASRLCRLRAAFLRLKLYRNNSGALPNPKTKRVVHFGLGNTGKKSDKKRRSPDDIGYYELTITPEMVGKKVAVFVGIEMKAADFTHRDEYPKNSREHAQKVFLDRITNAGGIAGFAKCPEDIDRILNDFLVRLMTNG